MQPSGMVSQPARTSQTVVLSEKILVAQSTSLANMLHTTTVSSDVPELQPTGPVDHNISSQNLTGKKVLPTSSLTGIASSQDPDSDLVQHSFPLSPAHPMEEEGKVSDQDTSMPEQELD